jgi:hypothetical protein
VLNGRPTLEERKKARQWLEQDIRLSRKAFESHIEREEGGIRGGKEDE